MGLEKPGIGERQVWMALQKMADGEQQPKEDRRSFSLLEDRRALNGFMN